MSYRPNLPISPATSTQAGVVKPDGVTITTASDATTSVVGVSVTSLTDISSGSLGGPAPSDIDTLNRAGTDYRVTLSARSALFRKTPAGSRTVTLTAGSTAVTLTAADNDKQVVVNGVAGNLGADGTVSDGFRCFVINKSAGILTYSGINGLSGATGLAAGSLASVYMAASVVEAAAGGANTLAAATTSTLGSVKPDGTTVTVASDGTLSVVTTTTHALPAGSALSAADELAAYASVSASDVKYTVGQFAVFAQSNLQSWTTSARPPAGSTQFVLGYNTTLSRFEYWNGTAWNQHVRASDFSATASQLFGGSGTAGVATAVSLGAGLQLSNGALSTTTAATLVTTVSSSGTAQALSFPAAGSRAYDITLTGNCTLSLSGGNPGELQTLTIAIRGGSGGFSVTLPSNVRWKGGTPSLDTSANAFNELRIQTFDGGASYVGNY